MIKVHVVSGFLGAGKTTFIMKAAEALMRRGEKIAVIENELGEAGIDTELLSGEGYRVFELLNGCICCTLKSDFTEAFLQIKEKIKPDRVFIEPSGIFVLDSIFDILQSPDLKEDYTLASVLTIVDARHFLRHEENYPEFLRNQVENAGKLLLTKTEGLRDLAMAYIRQKLGEINRKAEIVPDYRVLDDAGLISLMEAETAGKPIPVCPHCGHSHGHEGHAHEDSTHGCSAEDHAHPAHTAFETLLLKPEQTFTREELQKKLELLNTGDYGTILRAKGFIKSEKGFFSACYVDGDVNIAVKLRSVPVALQFIGLGLKKELLAGLFN